MSFPIYISSGNSTGFTEAQAMTLFPTFSTVANDLAGITEDLSKSLVPAINNTYDLGSNSYYYNNAYLNKAFINNTTLVDLNINGTTPTQAGSLMAFTSASPSVPSFTNAGLFYDGTDLNLGTNVLKANTYSYTFPNVTDVIVTESATQTLTSKSLTSAKINAGILFNASPYTTTLQVSGSLSGSNTLTLPIGSGNVVSDSATQTLTNKTLTSAIVGTSLQFPANGYTTLMEASASQSATNYFILPPNEGTNQYVLTTNGSGTLSWAEPALNNWLIGGITSSSTTLYLGINSGTSNLEIWSQGTAVLTLDSTSASFNAGVYANNDVSSFFGIDVGIASSQTGQIAFFNASNNYYITLESGVSTTDLTLTLPTTTAPNNTTNYTAELNISTLNVDDLGVMGYSMFQYAKVSITPTNYGNIASVPVQVLPTPNAGNTYMLQGLAIGLGSSTTGTNTGQTLSLFYGNTYGASYLTGWAFTPGQSVGSLTCTLGVYNVADGFTNNLISRCSGMPLYFGGPTSPSNSVSASDLPHVTLHVFYSLIPL